MATADYAGVYKRVDKDGGVIETNYDWPEGFFSMEKGDSLIFVAYPHRGWDSLACLLEFKNERDYKKIELILNGEESSLIKGWQFDTASRQAPMLGIGEG